MAASFALITDSTSDIPANLVKERQLYIAPLHVLWGQDNLQDGVDISIEQFHQRLASDPEHPTTSQPTPQAFADLYRLAREETGTESILVMTISADLSGTYSSAEQAAKMVDFPVRVVDVRTVTIATGLSVLQVADARDSGATLDEAEALARSMQTRTHLMFTVDTLEYLHKGGRIGGGRRLLGTALNIKPVLHVENGKVEALESVRTRKKAFSRLVELYQQTIDVSKPVHLGCLHSQCLDEAQLLLEALVARYQPASSLMTEIGPTIAVHAGPGAIGFAILQ